MCPHGNLIYQGIHVREISFDSVQDCRISTDPERGGLVSVLLAAVVRDETAGLLETLVAQLTVKPFLAALVFRVRFHMLLVCVLRIKALGAVFAVVYVVPAVDLHMKLKVRQPCESLSTYLTFQSVLDDPMLLKVVAVGEDLVAVGAAQIFGIGMYLADVLLVLVEEREGIVTLQTLVRLSIGVNLEVVDEGRLSGEALLADGVVAMVRAVVRMHALHVILQSVETSEGPITNLAADTRPVGIMNLHVSLETVGPIKHLIADGAGVDASALSFLTAKLSLLADFHLPLPLLLLRGVVSSTIFYL